MKRILYIIYIMVATLAVTLFGGCEEQVFEYDFINNVGEEPTPTPTPTPGVNAKNVIYYTSTDGKVITPKKDAFGVSIVSNTYTNGKGTITFSGTVTKIGEGTFYNCSTLASITIPNSVISIGNDAFCDCTSLKSVTIPNSVTSIGYDAFFNCSALTSVTIPNSVTSIGSLAFGNCTSLKSVTIPNSVTEIGDGAFRGCTSLKGIYGKFASEDNRCLIVDGVLNSFAPAGLTSYIIPNSVTSIGDWVFFGCTSLTSVTIPNSVTSIGSLTFSYCSKLAEVYCKPTTPPTLGGPTVFDGNASDRKIYVPSASVNAYKAAEYWSDYADQIVAEGSSAPSTTTNVIEYTSSEGNVVTPYNTSAFGANIVSNVYENGKGVITFDGPVTTIGEKAFYTRSTLASITIPDSVTSIGNYTFRSCTLLTSVTIPEGVTSIGYYAFEYCTSLTSVTIPNSVTEIGDYTFYNCSALTSVTIPNSVTSIGNWAFSNCTSLTSVTIPNSVTKMGESQFRECTSLKSFYGKFASEDNRCLIVNGELTAFAPAGLTSYIIPNDVTSIGKNVFYRCSSLTSMTIPDSVISIGDYVFDSCTKLTSVTIPESVTSIGNCAFYDCCALANVTIPKRVTSIGNNAFYGCSKLAEVYCKPTTPPTLGGSAVFDGNASGRKIYVPSASVNAYKTASNWSRYASQIVAEGSSTTEYVIEYTSSDGNIVTLNSAADFGANIVSNVYENGKGVIAFDGPVTTIGERVFSTCSTLASITIPNSVTSIGGGAFLNCTSLTSVTIPDSVTSIGYDAFCGCASLTSVTIPNSVTEMGVSPFRECTSLKSFYGKFASEDNRCLIVNGVLNSFAPAGLTSYIIPNSVTSIGNYTFRNCTSLTSVTIPESVTSIGNYAFNACSALANVTIPNSVTSIGSSAFGYCFGLTSVTIPNSVTSIRSSAFRNCTSLTSVTIPDSVTSIGNQAFYNCSKLAEVYCKPTTPPTLGGSSVFDSNASDRKMYVPSASVNAYKAANYWSEYASQIVADPSSGSTTTEYVIEYTSSDGNIVTPNSAADFGANIVSNVYENGKGVITFDGPVTKISNISTIHTVDESSFYDCKTLTSITIPDSVTSIRICQFVGCSSLKSFYGKFASEDNRCLIVNGVLTAFAPAGLTTYSIPENVTSINNHVFNSCTDLTSVTIPNSVTSMGYGVFVGCTSLKRVDITDLEAWCKIDFYSNNANPLNNGADLYLNGSKVTALTIPSSITEIKQYTFYGCPSLTSATIPNSVTKMGESPFRECTSLKSFYGKFASEDNRCLIVDGVLNTFAPAGLTSYIIPNGVTSIGNYAFDSCTSLTSVTIPNSVTSIGNYAFYYCSGLTKVTIGNSVTSIGNQAFYYCTKLTSVTIPNSVTSIGNYAFCSCSKLATVYCKPTTPPTLDGTYVFDYGLSSRKIYVPSASVDAYKTASNWSEYASQIVAE